MPTGVIIQARMTSSRFPKKVTAMLAGKPVLQHVIERAKQIPGIDMVIVAVPAQEVSIPIYQIANALDVYCASGSETDVLGRYWDAASMYGLTTKHSVIMRITSDCPLLSPLVAGEVLTMLKLKDCDYASNSFPNRTYPKGLDAEAFTWESLDSAHQVATAPYDREHVTPWMQRTSGIKKTCVCQKRNDSEINWCVDYPGDIARLEEVIKAGTEIKEGQNATKH